jgi:putative flippase GtrA
MRANLPATTGANCCGKNGLRGMRGCARDAASRQTAEREQVALHRPNGNSLNAPILTGAGSLNPSAGNDMRASAGCAGNSLSCNVLAANSLRGFCSRAGRENAAETGKDFTRTATLVRWCKFNLVGAVGICVQFGVLFFLKSELHFPYLAATALAVEAAVVHNFFWHERFTWADRIKCDRMRPSGCGHPAAATAQNLPSALFAALERRARQKLHSPGWHSASLRSLTSRSPRFGRFVRFNLTAGLVSIAGNLGMMRVMVGRVHMNYLFANAVAIAFCSLVNFVVSDGWVFGESKTFSQRILALHTRQNFLDGSG